ncbi:MAG: cbb3-type cytochrome c oxidase subunit I [Acidimicrobiales bacterium]
MAITETSVSPDVVEPAATLPPALEPRGVVGLVGTGDHKAIGRLWIGASLIFGIASLVLAAVTALGQRAGASFPPTDAVQRVFVLGRVGLVLFFLVPLFVGLATYVVPLQVGSATVAFPRGAAAAFWTWLIGAGMFVGATIANGGPGGTSKNMVDLSLVSLGLVLLALLLGAVAVATTVFTMRTRGMYVDRVPMFSWSMVVATGVWFLTVPVAIANLTLIFLDHNAGGPSKFGVATDQWGQLQWLFAQPQVFAWAIPALGVAADAVATLSRGRQPGRGFVMTGIGAFGVLAIGAWAQPAFIPSVYDQATFVVVSCAISIPVVLVLAGMLVDLRKGSRASASPVALSFLSVVLLLLAGAAAIAFVLKPLRLHGEGAPTALADLATFTWGQPAVQVGLTGLIVLAAAAAGLAGIYYWGPKITGHRVSDGPGKLVVILIALATLLYGLPYVALGFAARWTTIADAADTLSLIAVAGAALGAVALLVGAFSLLSSLTADGAPDDPWECGQTLEWACPSPPPRGNFGELAEVTSAQPLLDWRGEED